MQVPWRVFKTAHWYNSRPWKWAVFGVKQTRLLGNSSLDRGKHQRHDYFWGSPTNIHPKKGTTGWIGLWKMMSIVGRNMTKEGLLENSIPPWICIIRCLEKSETKSLLPKGGIWWWKSHPIKIESVNKNSQKKNTNPSYRGWNNPSYSTHVLFFFAIFWGLLNYVLYMMQKAQQMLGKYKKKR